MVVRRSSSVDLGVPVAQARPWLAGLDAYPEWMTLVHSAHRVATDAWDVEIRARVGPFARSKRLRMVRTVDDPLHVVFVREETDGKVHAPWTLEIVISPRGDGCSVSVEMTYGGSLWTAGLLDKVLAQHIEAGKAGLVRVTQTP